MLLILDPSDFYFDPEKNKKSKSHKKIMGEVMTEISEELFLIPEETLSRITRINIVNPYGELYQYSENDHKSFLRSLTSKTDKAKLLSTLFKKLKFENLNDTQSRIDYVTRFITTEQTSEIIFIDTLLTNFIAATLSLCSNLVGYRWVEDSKEGWELKLITDVNRYLDIALTRYHKSIRSVAKQFHFDNQLINVQIKSINKVFSEQVEQKSKTKFIAMFKKWEHNEYNDFISWLRNRFGGVIIYKCSETQKPPKIDRPLLVQGIDNLEEQAQLQLLNDLSGEEYHNSFIIIETEKYIDTKGFAHFKYWINSKDFVKASFDFIHQLISDMIAIMDNKIEEYKYLINFIVSSDRQKNKFYKEIEELAVGDILFDAKKIDFWYDIRGFDLIDKKKVEGINQKLEEKLFPSVGKIKFAIRPEGNYWVIIKNDVEPATKKEKKKSQFDFTQSKNIRYLVYVIKNFGVKNSTNYEELSRIVSKWMTDKEKVVAKNTLYESIDNLFKRYKILEPIKKYFYYNNPAKVYYQENNEIEFDFSKIEIPNIHLENK